MSDEKRLNPDIKEVEYGKKELKTLIIYPLSLGDQFKVTDMITKVIQEIADSQKAGQVSDYAVVDVAVTSIKENIGKILSLIADLPKDKIDKIIYDLTNTQLMELVDIVWSVNFEPALKKGKSLFEKGRSVFGSKSLSQSSSSVIPNTDSKMSIEKVTDKEE
jgi:hypothetical protein